MFHPDCDPEFIVQEIDDLEAEIYWCIQHPEAGETHAQTVAKINGLRDKQAELRKHPNYA